MLGSSLVVKKWGRNASLDWQLWSHENVEILFALQPYFFVKFVDFLFDNVMFQDGLICDDVGLCSEFNKFWDGIVDIDIVLGDITEGTGTNNKVYTYHGALIGSIIVVADGGRIL